MHSDFPRAVRRSVPQHVPDLFRAGTGPVYPGRFANSLLGFGLGVPGARSASLPDPWPFVCLGVPARLRLATSHAGRSATVPHKGPGLRPGTPANSSHAPRVRFRVLSAFAPAVRRRLRRPQPNLIADSFLPA